MVYCILATGFNREGAINGISQKTCYDLQRFTFAEVGWFIRIPLLTRYETNIIYCHLSFNPTRLSIEVYNHFYQKCLHSTICQRIWHHGSRSHGEYDRSRAQSMERSGRRWDVLLHSTQWRDSSTRFQGCCHSRGSEADCLYVFLVHCHAGCLRASESGGRCFRYPLHYESLYQSTQRWDQGYGSRD